MSGSVAVTIYTDGGARGNPGPAGTGVVIEQHGKIVETVGAYIGEATNNQAEYSALLAGLDRASRYTDTDLRCVLDSELVVRQLNGEYRIRSEQLRKLADQANHLAQRFRSVSYEHVRREGNVLADKLVNRAIDVRGTVRSING